MRRTIAPPDPMQNTTFRLAERRDWPAIVDIYNQAIAEGGKTGDMETYTVEQRHGWFADHDGATYPLFVADDATRVTGYCSLSAYRPGRRALRHVAEISYFIDRAHRGRGLGRTLVEHALRQAPRYGFRHLYALLLDVNEPSIRLLERTGFTRWGHLPNIADFDTFVCGQFIYGRAVSPTENPEGP